MKQWGCCCVGEFIAGGSCWASGVMLHQGFTFCVMMVKDRTYWAKRSLLGLSIGDAFGESFFGETQAILAHLEAQTIPDSSWEFTDDTLAPV